MMSAEIAAVLRRAAELIPTPERWCQHASSITADGKPGGGRHPGAVRWCVSGAIAAVCEYDALVFDAEAALAEQIDGPVTCWNDDPERRHSEVLAALRAAAEAEERNG